jgi:rhodanese-related sulfurtransferase
VVVVLSPTHSAPKAVKLINLAILLAGLLLTGILIRKLYFPVAATYDYQLATGARLSIPELDWATGPTLLLAMRTDCKFCTESAPFYRRLASAVRNERKARIVVVFPEHENGAEAYVRQLAITADEVRYVSLDSLGIKNTPTVAIVNDQGAVTNFWVGRLPPRGESAVMKALSINDPQPVSVWQVDEPTFHARAERHEPVVLIDLRERLFFAANHKAGARNIPLDELKIRAANELKSSDYLILYGDDYETDTAFAILDSEGFSRIAFMAPDTARPVASTASKSQ